ncbi:MAG: NADPH:quinone oxidoreductase family protein [Rhodospirillales bacterium]|nr:NADPH:quinone oxidoreductase family protein [Rhodospirillales bacterium]
MQPKTMRAIEIRALDGPGSARLVETDVPKPRAGEALIRVKAAGINFADTMQTRGRYIGGPTPPYIAGNEACGQIEALGRGVDGFAVGDRVIGVGVPGAFAEYHVVPATNLMPVPEGWSDAQAAGFFVDWATAIACVKICGQVQPGQTVLVHAAAGGVGQANVALARHYGATVIATASTREKLRLAESLGAHHIVNYVEKDFEAAVRDLTGGLGVDVALEMVGGEVFQKTLRVVRPYGRLVVFGIASNDLVQISNKDIIFHYPFAIVGQELGALITKRPDLMGPAMNEIHDLVKLGVIARKEPEVHPLENAATAMTRLETRQTIGKLVLVP